MLSLSSSQARPATLLKNVSGLSPERSINYEDLIVAPATPQGQGARAILRLTGNHAWSVVRSLLHPKEDISAEMVQGRFPSQLRLPDFFSPLPVQIQAWQGPWTYTGQDLVELHLVSSPPLVQALLDHLLELGARLAEPGEFTLRAFLAGKLDLTQVEAVHALSTSSDSQELRTALTQLAGGLSRPLDALREEILLLLAEVEAGLDFADEDLSLIDNDSLLWRVDACRSALMDVQDRLREQGKSSAVFRVVLAGLPNAGKSSLFNTLIGQHSALVSAQPGTTRDYLTRTLQVQGVSLELVDTAGSEQTTGTIEQQAQALRHEQMHSASLLLYCFDSTKGLDDSEHRLIQQWPNDKLLLVATKSDLPGDPAISQAIQTSTVTGAGMATLRLKLAEHARRCMMPALISPSLHRCQKHLESSIKSLVQAGELLHEHQHMELVAAELRTALDQIGCMVGAVYTEDLLGRIFSQFCIGK